MLRKCVILTIVGVWALACGGVGSSASDQANRMGEFKANEENVPCPTFGAGEDVVLKNFTFKIISGEKVEAETRLPWIKNSDERSNFTGTKSQGFKVHYQIRNDAPVSKAGDHSMALIAKDGEKHYCQPYNSGLASKAAGLSGEWANSYAPDVWLDEMCVYSIPHDAVVEPVLYFTHVDYERNDVGRKVRVLYEHAVTDLPPITEGASLRQ